MLAAVASWSAMMVFVRALSADYAAFQILFVRALVGLALLAPLLRRTGISGLRTRRPGLHLARAILAFFGMLGLFVGIGEIPLADVVALSFTQPIFIAVLAAALLGERFGGLRVAATLCGFLGVLIIARPGFEAVGLRRGGRSGGLSSLRRIERLHQEAHGDGYADGRNRLGEPDHVSARCGPGRVLLGVAEPGGPRAPDRRRRRRHRRGLVRRPRLRRGRHGRRRSVRLPAIAARGRGRVAAVRGKHGRLDRRGSVGHLRQRLDARPVGSAPRRRSVGACPDVAAFRPSPAARG